MRRGAWLAVLATVGLALAGACRPLRTPPEDVFRRGTKRVDIAATVPIARGAVLEMHDTALTVIDASDAAAPKDLALAAARAIEGGGAIPEPQEPPRVGPWGPAAAFAPTSEEPASVALRARIRERTYGVACSASRVATAYTRHARASLSCAITRIDARSGAYWALTVRTRGHEQRVQRLRGLLEPRGPRGPIAGAPHFTVGSSDDAVEQRGADGKTRSVLIPNAFVTLRRTGRPVASVRTRSYGGPPRAWLDVGSLDTDDEADAARISAALMAWLPWPEG